MSDSYMGMKKETYCLLYTNKKGEKEDFFEMCLLEDTDTPWDRVEKLISLLRPVSSIENILIPLESAKLLTSWGNEDGLRYLESLVENRVDKLGCISPHRIHAYDEIYEEIQYAATNYFVRHFDRSKEKGKYAAQRIEYILLNIIELSSNFPFQLVCLSYIKDYFSRTSYEPALKECFVELVKESEYKWKIDDLKKLLLKWDSDFVNETLRKYCSTDSL